MKRLFYFSIAFFAMMLVPSVAQAQSAATLSSMLQNLSQSVPGVVQMIFGVSYVMGVFLVLRSVYKFKGYAQAMSQMSGDKSIVKPLILFFVGVGFIYLPGVMDSMLTTLWSAGTSSVVAYPATSGQPWDDVVQPLVILVRVFGLISIVKGWMLLSKLGSEGHSEGSTGKAIIHLVGGICAWNIVGLWKLIENTLGVGSG